MMWIGDLENLGFVPLAGFAKLISTVYAPGYVTRFDWKTRRPRLHHQALAAEILDQDQKDKEHVLVKLDEPIAEDDVGVSAPNALKDVAALSSPLKSETRLI